jgi:H+-transporting ATPase
MKNFTSAEDAFSKLSSRETGLSAAEAKARLTQYGYNEIAEKKKNPLIKFLSYFWGAIPWMIEAAAIISAIIRHWEDFAIICLLLLLNAVVRFWQERKADNAIELLKQKLALKARVLRDNAWTGIPARELVPGDVIRVRLGDIIPADVILIKGDYMLADESALTGESLPVEKHVPETSYSGSIVRQGEMDAMVIATGMESFFGKTARLVSEATNVSHFQKAVIKIGDYLIAIAVMLVVLIFIVALFRHEGMLEILNFALVLVVASIPAALPAVLSVTMAVGATALAKKDAIVSNLVAIEEMAGMDVLCTDKTGTITKNELTVAELLPLGGSSGEEILKYASLASRTEDKDPIDDAILAKAGSGQSVYKITAFHPFDPVTKRTESEIEDESGRLFKASKGAPQAILELVPDKAAVEPEVKRLVEEMAAKGHRSLGVARTDEQGNWKYAGIIAIYDPPRDDSAQTIKTAQSMGVNVKMVTGDHSAIAKEIAGRVNLGAKILEPASFIERPDREARRLVEEADGFAQVFPEHKYHIVELLQQGGHIVGMTGDGVNDAPALKKADAGIAVSGATDAAKSAADIVLTMPGLSVIIDAIKESRKIFQRMTNYSIYRIAETIRVLFFITVSILVFKFYPITALMIVLLALLNDAPIMSIAYDNVIYSDKPESWNMRAILGIATFLGIIGVVASFGILYIGDRVLYLDRDTLQSFIYLKLSVAGQMTVYIARTRKHFWSIRPGIILLSATVLTQTIATLIVVYGIFVAPIGWELAALVWVYAFVAFIITDYLKVLLYRLFEHKDIVFQSRSKVNLSS